MGVEASYEYTGTKISRYPLIFKGTSYIVNAVSPGRTDF